MKKTIYLFPALLLLALLPLQTYAKIVRPAEAEKTVRAFIQRGISKGIRPQATSQASVQLAWDSHALNPQTRSSEEAPAFYVYDIQDGNGFVIISAEDALTPIIGYSFENPMGDPKQMPDNLKSWLGIVISRVNYARAHDLKPTAATQKAWSDAWPGNTLVQYETAKWDQHYPFNLQCPEINGKRAVTGCVATAISIVMRYHQCPGYGTGSSESYQSDGVYVPARDLTHKYNWNKMPTESYSYSNYTEEEKQEIARLIADVGALCRLDYGLGATTGYLGGIYDIAKKLKYTEPDIASMDYYNPNDWSMIVKSQIYSKGPVVFRGNDMYYNTGHAFVLDGYTSNNYFHVNWGWSSNGNGNFTLDDMGVYDSDFSYNQQIILSFDPLDIQYNPITFSYDRSQNTVRINHDKRFTPQILLDGQTTTEGIYRNEEQISIHLNNQNNGKQYTIRFKDNQGKLIKEFTFDTQKID